MSGSKGVELIEALPKARLLEIEPAGHNVHLERPEQVLEALHAHLTAPDAGSGLQPTVLEVPA